MAYPTLDGPYGFKPVRLLGGQPYAGAFGQYPVLTGTGTAIFYGDVVTLGASGNALKATATDTATLILGVFVGCSYTNATTGQKQFSQYCPVSPPSDTMAFIVDDPQVVYKAAVCTSTTSLWGVTQLAVGQRAPMILNAGSTTTGNSKFAVDAATDTTATLPLKIVGVIPETVNSSGSSTEVLVVFNPGGHFMANTVGV